MLNPSEFAYAGPHVSRPSLVVTVTKLYNGYVTVLQETPKQDLQPAIGPAPSPFEGMEPDEIVDKMIDGIGAVLRSFRDSEVGDDWKGSADREKVREAFKVMFPDFVQRAVQLTSQDPVLYKEPRNETRVHESKDSLMLYLDLNLTGTEKG